MLPRVRERFFVARVHQLSGPGDRLYGPTSGILLRLAQFLGVEYRPFRHFFDHVSGATFGEAQDGQNLCTGISRWVRLRSSHPRH